MYKWIPFIYKTVIAVSFLANQIKAHVYVRAEKQFW
jgi:hypothetical protein